MDTSQIFSCSLYIWDSEYSTLNLGPKLLIYIYNFGKVNKFLYLGELFIKLRWVRIKWDKCGTKKVSVKMDTHTCSNQGQLEGQVEYFLKYRGWGNVTVKKVCLTLLLWNDYWVNTSPFKWWIAWFHNIISTCKRKNYYV